MSLTAINILDVLIINLQPMRVLTQRLITIALSLLLFVVLTLTPDLAIADKAPKAFPLDTTHETITVATIYQTSYATQKGVLKALKMVKANLKKATGFKGMAILQSQDASQVVIFSQWQDLASFQAYAEKPLPPNPEAETTSPPPTPDRTTIYEVAASQTRQSNGIPTLRGKEAIVEFSEFNLKQPDDQSQILATLESWMADILQQQPIPQSVMLLQSADRTKLALLANWNCTADFEETGKPVGFDQPDPAWADWVEADQQFYNVKQMMPGTPEKQKS